MRARIGIAVAVLAAAAITLAVVSCGSEDSSGPTAGGEALVWDKPPLIIHPEALPDDRVVYGTVRNGSAGSLGAAVGDFDVRDANGHKLVATLRFLGTFAHGLYGAYGDRPHPLPEKELTRLGYQVDLAPGETAPLTVSFRLRESSQLPATLYYRGAPALDLPVDG